MYLGIDIGTQSVEALLIGVEQRILGLAPEYFEVFN